MKRPFSSLMIVLMSLAIVFCAIIAGCTSPSQPAAGQKLSTVEPSQMALQEIDVPANFTLVEAYERNASDMREWALEKGWKKGYGTYYATNGPDARGLDQTISVYPLENISFIIPDTVSGYKNWTIEDRNITVAELPSPGIGDASSALKVSLKGDPIDIYVITFVKYDVYEELDINGTVSEYEMLMVVAEKAAARIT